MPIPFNELLPASYNGVEFLWQSNNITGGPKSVTNEYPNSTKRSVKFLGVNERTISVSAIIDNDQYRTKREALRVELNKPEIGTLVLPLIGTLKVAVKSWGFSEDKKELGIANFTITFEETDNSETAPQPAISNQGEVLIQSESTLDELQSIVSDGFIVSPEFINNFDDAEDIINQAIDAFDENTKNFSTESRDNFANLVTNSALSVVNYINNGETLAQALRDFFDEMPLLNDDARQRVDMYETFFTFGDNFVPFNITTAGREERKKNRDVILLNMQASSLAQAYNDVVLIEFDTVDDLDEVSSSLDSQYEKVIELPETNDEVRQLLADLKAKARIVLDEQRITAPRIASVDVYNSPLTILTYQYYADLDNYDSLLRLNGPLDTSMIEGENQILTA